MVFGYGPHHWGQPVELSDRIGLTRSTGVVLGCTFKCSRHRGEPGGTIDSSVGPAAFDLGQQKPKWVPPDSGDWWRWRHIRTRAVDGLQNVDTDPNKHSFWLRTQRGSEFTDGSEIFPITTALRCSTRHAPWHIVPANKKWYRDYVVAKTVCEELEELELRWPKPEPGLNKIRIK